MVKNRKSKRAEAKKKIEASIEILQEQINNLKLNLQEFSDSDTSTEEKQIVVGDKVESVNYPWYNGVVDSISKNRYWVYIKVGREIKKKAAHNVRVVSGREN